MRSDQKTELCINSIGFNSAASPFNVGSKAEMLWLIPLLVMSVALTWIAEVLSYFNGTSAISMVSEYGWKACRMLPLIASIGVIMQAILAVLRDYKTAADTILDQWKALLCDPYLLAARVLPIITMPFFFASFSVLKMLMPLYIPFWLDEPFAKIDKFLFLGHQPWELTHAIFTTPAATQTFDLLYSIWILLLSAAIAGFA